MHRSKKPSRTSRPSNFIGRIRQSFPLHKIKLSYEKRIHNKVSSESAATFYLAIPYGKKYFAWFTLIDRKPRCILLEIKRQRGNLNIQYIHMNYVATFDKTLCSGIGTILYGTMNQLNRQQYFVIENLLFLKNQTMASHNEYQKFMTINTLFRDDELKQNTTLPKHNMLMFVTPVIENTYTAMLKQINQLPYKVYAIQSRDRHRVKQTYMNFIGDAMKGEESKELCTFMVRAAAIDDLYLLYTAGGESVGTASVQTYGDSVRFNRVFRNIRENENLDYIEESDDEEVFQDVDEGKFLKKEVDHAFVKCKYLFNEIHYKNRRRGKSGRWVLVEPCDPEREKIEVSKASDVTACMGRSYY